MVKTNNIEQKIKSKTSKDLKKSEKVKQIKEEKKETLQKIVKTDIKTKKIKKVKKSEVVEEKKKVREVKAKIENYSEFVKVETSKYKQLRKRTIQMIQLDKQLIKKAVKSLLKYYEGNKKQNDILDGGDEFIYLEVVLGQLPEKYSIRPVQIPLPVPIYQEKFNSNFCIFVRNPQRQYKDKIADMNIPQIGRVMGYDKISKKFPTTKEKNKLVYSHDLFFCDYRIYDIMRKPTGNAFYKRKKIPFPIDCENVPDHLKEELGDNYENYLNSLSKFTYFSMGNGPSYTLKVSRVDFDVPDTVKNIIHGIYNMVPYLLKEGVKHNNVRSISIKTYNSISLPVYNQLTEQEIKAYQE